MPHINVTLTGRPDASLSSRVAQDVTKLTQIHLGKDPAVTAVAVSYIEPEHWFAGGRSLSAQAANSYWLDIKVTEATNTKEQMAAYIDAIHTLMSSIMSGVHTESYVLVHAVPAAAYGYGGKTQEYRFIAGRVGK